VREKEKERDRIYVLHGSCVLAPVLAHCDAAVQRCKHVCVYVCACVFVCVRERETVCVCVCVLRGSRVPSAALVHSDNTVPACLCICVCVCMCVCVCLCVTWYSQLVW